MTSVNLKASGYTWRCPECHGENYTGAAPSVVICSKCNGTFDVKTLVHRRKRENVPSSQILSNGAVQGVTDFGSTGYGGPCPPSGTHRYFFKLYALDCTLGLSPGAKKKQVVEAMNNHILAQGQLMGKYKRQR